MKTKTNQIDELRKENRWLMMLTKALIRQMINKEKESNNRKESR